MKSGSEFVFSSLKKVDRQNLFVRHIVLVPDRASLEAERQLLKNLGGSFNVEVLTIRRFANRVLPKFKYLSKQSGIVALSALIEDNKQNLSCYTKGIDNAGFVENMYETISQLKYCMISPKKLTAEKLPQNVKNKLKDIALLYDGYQQFLQGSYVDSADKLNLLAEEIQTSELVKNSFFYLFDFDNLSAQELAIFEKLAVFSKGVTVACCFSSDNYKRYLYLNDIYNGVLSVCQKIGETPNIIDYNSYTNKFCRQIENFLFSFKNVTPLECGDFVEIFEGSTRVQEVYALACKVRQYVESGGRFRDVYAITSDINKYANAISSVFNEFEIPYFCDRQFCLSDHIFSQFVVDFFNMQKNDLQFSSVLNFAKNHFFSDGDSDVYLFENYCLKYNVNFLSRKSTRFTLGAKEPDLLAAAERVRKNLMDVVFAVPVKNVDSTRSFVDLARKLCEYSLLVEKNNSFSEQQRQGGLEFESKVTAQVAEKFFDALSQIEDILGDRETTLENFLKTLKATLASVNISAIPLFSDCVVFANMAKARKHDIKFLALLGANQGQMPILKSDSKLLNDSNIEQMNNCGIFLEPQISVENRRERFSLFQLLCEPEQKLFVSYTATDGKDSLLASSFVNELGQIFLQNGKPLSTVGKADENVYTVKQAISKLVLNKRRLLDNQSVKMPSFATLSSHFKDDLEKFDFKRDFKKIEVSNGKQLFLKKPQTSVSKVTSFFRCPYMFFLHYGLGISKRVEASIESKDLGDILHKVLENFVDDNVCSQTDEQTKAIAENLFDEVLSDDFWKAVATDASMKNILNELKKEAVKVCLVTKEHLQNSDFKKLATEFEFGGNSGAKGVDVSFSNDSKISLTGKIDRIDVYEDMFFVIDYKSGADEFSEKELYIGQKLQLLVYLKAVEANFEKLKPVGFYYFNLHNSFVEQSEKRPFCYNGRTLSDPEIAKHIDTQFFEGSTSQRLGLQLTLGGDFKKRSVGVISAEQMKAQMEYATTLIARAGELMEAGYIAATPYDKVCGFCDFSSVCDFSDIHQFDPRLLEQSISPSFFEDTVVEQAAEAEEADE